MNYAGRLWCSSADFTDDGTPSRQGFVGARGLKQESGQDILMFGSGTLAQTLMQYHLIDEYRLLIYPLILGKGKRLFQDEHQFHLKLIESKPFSSGAVLLCYQLDRKES